MTSRIGWRFPPTNGGQADGFNDPGIAHFNGLPLTSLARETIQNSLDARGTLGTPVHVPLSWSTSALKILVEMNWRRPSWPASRRLETTLWQNVA